MPAAKPLDDEEDLEGLLSPRKSTVGEAEERLVGSVLPDILLRVLKAWLVGLVVVLVMAHAARNWCPELARNPLRMNQIQMLGTRNSFHVAPRPEILELLIKQGHVDMARSLNYTHKPLPDQLLAGYRHLELEVLYDPPPGGRYYSRAVLAQLGQPSASGIPALLEPGYKVHHRQDLDFESTCLTLVECLLQVREFSDAAGRHFPIGIKIEIVAESVPELPGAQVPLPVTEQALLDLEEEIASVFTEKDRMVTPDDVRGGAATLLDAVRGGGRGWPQLRDAAGKVFFMLTPNGAVEAYRRLSPDLSGRTLFTAYTPSGPGDVPHTPDQAVLNVRQLPGPAVRELVRSGHLVVTAAGPFAAEARRDGGASGWDAALESGSQIVQTDCPLFELGPDGCNNPFFGTPHVAALPGNVQARCNPQTAPDSCRFDGAQLREPLPK